MLANERTRRVAHTRFTSHEVTINKGNALALDGWWSAGEECLALNATASEYARVASRESAKKNTGKRKPYSEATIRQMVGYVLRAIEQGDKRSTYDGLDHLRATMTQTSTKKGKVVEPTGKRVVTRATRNAYEALMKTAEFRALPAGEKALIRKLSKGEAFHTNIG